MTTDRFTIKPSEKEGFWIARDNEAGITIEFFENKYNEEQTVSLDDNERAADKESAQQIATALRELGDWISSAYPEIVFTATELRTHIVNIFRGAVSLMKEQQDGQSIPAEYGGYVEYIYPSLGPSAVNIMKKFEWLLLPEDMGALLERIEFECDAVNNGARAAIGRRIAALRRELGFSQRELAARAGISQPNLTNIEAGKYSAGLDILWRISRALGRSLYIV